MVRQKSVIYSFPIYVEIVESKSAHLKVESRQYVDAQFSEVAVPRARHLWVNFSLPI